MKRICNEPARRLLAVALWRFRVSVRPGAGAGLDPAVAPIQGFYDALARRDEEGQALAPRAATTS